MTIEWIRGAAAKQAKTQRRMDEIDAKLQTLWAQYLDELSDLAAGKVGLAFLPLALVDLASMLFWGLFLEASLLHIRFEEWRTRRYLAAECRKLDAMTAGFSEKEINDLLDRYYQQRDEEGK